jgi:acyl-CoA synthetase (AMP-forming)/AMP-acid ligase II
MVVLPFYYVMGKSLLNTHFAAGGSVVINNKFAFPAAVLNEMVSEKVTGFSGVPSTYAFLLHRSPIAAYRDKLTSLRYCSQAGGHMSRVIKEGLRQVLPVHTDIYIMYGATEAAARLSYLEPERFKDKMDSIGKAIPGVTLTVMDEEGREVQIGQVGELVASGENIMRGYWKDPEMTARVLDTKGYHTGDLCYQDKEGFFYVLGRKDNLLKVGGHRINPREVEDVLMGTGLVMEAIVLGIPDELLGHRLIALVTPKSQESTPDIILNVCTSRLPRYQVPSIIECIHSLPKSAGGKIDPAKCVEIVKRRNLA